MTRRVRGLAATASDQELREWEFERRDLRPDDVAVRITFCGVCHTDLHAWHGEPAYGNVFPLVPGHEFVGVVAAVGDDVSDFAVGDAVAVATSSIRAVFATCALPDTSNSARSSRP